MTPANRISPTAAAFRPDPVHCAVGDTLREVRILSESEWDALPQGSRPRTAAHVPGLGWVVAMMPGRAK